MFIYEKENNFQTQTKIKYNLTKKINLFISKKYL